MLTPQDPITPIDTANSYQTLADARTLAARFGYTLSIDDACAEKDMIKAFRYVESYECDMNGERTTEVQNTAYPRANLSIRCKPFADDAFPSDLLLSQVVAAHYAYAGIDLSGGIDDGKAITEETVGKISVTYADNGKTGTSVSIPQFDSTIKPLLRSGCGFSNIIYRI
jgi:hypothetical protein